MKEMRVTVCELPHEKTAFSDAWEALCEHTIANASELVLLPEFAMLEPVWESEQFDANRWSHIEVLSAMQLRRLSELRAPFVVGTRPARINTRRLNEAFLWSHGDTQPLRSKYFMPQEAGNWEATWFHKGDAEFAAFRAGEASFGVNICTELWAPHAYSRDVDLLLCPRATARATQQKWLAAGVVSAVRSGVFCLSSNRVDPSGACGGGGWIIDPDGEVLAVTSAATPFATYEIDLVKAAQAKESYPRYVFR